MNEELVDVVNSSTGLPIGEKVTKNIAHDKGIWHLAAHIWIYNSRGEILLQFRSKQKKLFPSLWDISVAGHIGAGEEALTCAIREMKEEIGLSVKPSDLEKVFTFKFSVSANDNMQNNEVCSVFLFKYDGLAKDLVLQKEEVEKVKFFSIDFLKKEFSNTKHAGHYLLPRNLSVPRVFELVKERTKQN
ncbi:MAG: NUDIX domain-containing protein [archaeon]